MSYKRIVKIEIQNVIVEKWLPEYCDDWNCRYIFHWKQNNGLVWYTEAISDYDGHLYHEGIRRDLDDSDDWFESLSTLIILADQVDDYTINLPS